jgi:hypothetical protein
MAKQKKFAIAKAPSLPQVWDEVITLLSLIRNRWNSHAPGQMMLPVSANGN